MVAQAQQMGTSGRSAYDNVSPHQLLAAGSLAQPSDTDPAGAGIGMPTWQSGASGARNAASRSGAPPEQPGGNHQPSHSMYLHAGGEPEAASAAGQVPGMLAASGGGQLQHAALAHRAGGVGAAADNAPDLAAGSSSSSIARDAGLGAAIFPVVASPHSLLQPPVFAAAHLPVSALQQSSPAAAAAGAEESDMRGLEQEPIFNDDRGALVSHVQTGLPAAGHEASPGAFMQPGRYASGSVSSGPSGLAPQTAAQQQPDPGAAASGTPGILSWQKSPSHGLPSVASREGEPGPGASHAAAPGAVHTEASPAAARGWQQQQQQQPAARTSSDITDQRDAPTPQQLGDAAMPKEVGNASRAYGSQYHDAAPAPASAGVQPGSLQQQQQQTATTTVSPGVGPVVEQERSPYQQGTSRGGPAGALEAYPSAPAAQFSSSSQDAAACSAASGPLTGHGSRPWQQAGADAVHGGSTYARDVTADCPQAGAHSAVAVLPHVGQRSAQPFSVESAAAAPPTYMAGEGAGVLPRSSTGDAHTGDAHTTSERWKWLLDATWAAWRSTCAESQDRAQAADKVLGRVTRHKLGGALRGWLQAVQALKVAREAAGVLSRGHGLRQLAACFNAWRRRVDALGKAYEQARTMAVQQRLSLQSEVLSAWKAEACEAPDDVRMVRRVAMRIASVLLRNVFSSWLYQVRQAQQHGARAAALCFRRASRTLQRTFQEWLQATQHHNRAVSRAGEMGRAHDVRTLRAAWQAWSALNQHAQEAEQAAEQQQCRVHGRQLRAAFTAWLERAKGECACSARVEEALARRSRRMQLRVLQTWSMLVTFWRAQRLAVTRFEGRRQQRQLHLHFCCWLEQVQERRRQMDELKACIKRKKIAFAYFKQWYWSAFDAEVQETIRHMFYTTEPAARSPLPSRRTSQSMVSSPDSPLYGLPAHPSATYLANSALQFPQLGGRGAAGHSQRTTGLHSGQPHNWLAGAAATPSQLQPSALDSSSPAPLAHTPSRGEGTLGLPRRPSQGSTGQRQADVTLLGRTMHPTSPSQMSPPPQYPNAQQAATWRPVTGAGAEQGPRVGLAPAMSFSTWADMTAMETLRSISDRGGKKASRGGSQVSSTPRAGSVQPSQHAAGIPAFPHTLGSARIQDTPSRMAPPSVFRETPSTSSSGSPGAGGQAALGGDLYTSAWRRMAHNALYQSDDGGEDDMEGDAPVEGGSYSYEGRAINSRVLAGTSGVNVYKASYNSIFRDD